MAEKKSAGKIIVTDQYWISNVSYHLTRRKLEKGPIHRCVNQAFLEIGYIEFVNAIITLVKSFFFKYGRNNILKLLFFFNSMQIQVG
jgi:hypothetical protein